MALFLHVHLTNSPIRRAGMCVFMWSKHKTEVLMLKSATSTLYHQRALLPVVIVWVPEAASILYVVSYGESALKYRTFEPFFRDNLPCSGIIPENPGHIHWSEINTWGQLNIDTWNNTRLCMHHEIAAFNLSDACGENRFPLFPRKHRSPDA